MANALLSRKMLRSLALYRSYYLLQNNLKKTNNESHTLLGLHEFHCSQHAEISLDNLMKTTLCSKIINTSLYIDSMVNTNYPVYLWKDIVLILVALKCNECLQHKMYNK